MPAEPSPADANSSDFSGKKSDPSRNSTPDDDAALLRLVKDQSSESAFAELVKRHSPYLYGVARALADNPHDAEDLVQDVFLAVLTGKFRGESSVRTWLVGILVKRAAMLRRSRMRIGPAPPDAAATPASPASDARMDLAQMLDALSPEHREVIVLRELQGMTYEQMAIVLSVPRGTVESRLHRARQQLKERFKNYSE